MNKIKTLLLTVAVVATGLLFAGCANVPANQRIATLSKVAAYDGTYLYLKDHPAARPAFLQAVSELEALEAEPVINVTTLLGIVGRLPVKELHSEAATLIIGSTTLVLSDYVTDLPVEQLENIRPIIKAIKDGIKLGLGPTPSPGGWPKAEEPASPFSRE